MVLTMKTALVTGGNRGIGLGVCRKLHGLGYRVLLAARKLEDAECAASEVGGKTEPVHIDVTDEESIDACAHALEAAGVRLSALVNNAGASFDGFDRSVAARTLATNFFGPLRVTRRMVPLIERHACVVMVSSGMGHLSHVSRGLAQRLLDPKLALGDLVALMESFPREVGQNTHEKTGWPSNAYSTSKVGLNALTRVLAREIGDDGPLINAVDPGWVRTRMGGSGAPRSIEQGADSVVWAATLDPSGPRGGFFRDGTAIAW
jgi:NAD(P)-dependent dehydrogenase (short-subunit alcohol dehydrogenase family)